MQTAYGCRRGNHVHDSRRANLAAARLTRKARFGWPVPFQTGTYRPPGRAVPNVQIPQHVFASVWIGVLPQKSRGPENYADRAILTKDQPRRIAAIAKCVAGKHVAGRSTARDALHCGAIW